MAGEGNELITRAEVKAVIGRCINGKRFCFLASRMQRLGPCRASERALDSESFVYRCENRHQWRVFYGFEERRTFHPVTPEP